MAKRTDQDTKHYPEQVKLVILDLDGFLYPYNKDYIRAAASAALAIRKQYHLPVFREKEAKKLIEEAKKALEKDPDDPLFRYIAKLSDRLEEKGLPAVSVIGMLEAGYNIWKVQRRSGEAAEEGDLAPPYKEMIASACNLQMLRDQREGSKKKLTREELKAKIIEGDVGITRLWHDHMGTSFLKPDSALAGKIRGLQEAGVEVAILTHSCRRGQGGAIAKVKELGLADLIPERYVFGLEELAPHKKGKHPEAFEHVLAAVNHMLHKAEPILPPETVMGDDTIGNLRGARKAGMETVWVRGTNHELPAHPSRKMEEKLACVDHIYATPYQFLDALMASMNAAKAAGPEVKEQGQGRTTVEQGGGPR